MNHLNDDELVLHYYGEGGPRIVVVERHLGGCAQCARAYDALVRTLNAVTPPEYATAPDDMASLHRAIRARLHEQRTPQQKLRTMRPEEPAIIGLGWLVALAYPFSFQALFSSARLTLEPAAGVPLVMLTLAWSCAGPFVAAFALNQMAGRSLHRTSARALVAGAVIAAICPSLFLLVSRLSVGLSLNGGLWLWYGAIALAALTALVPWPRVSGSSERFLFIHRLSATVLTVYVLAHVVNQALAFVSVPAYTAMRGVMRVASDEPASYTLIVASVLVQIATGAAMGIKHVRAGAVARNLQAVSGWYLAAFLLTHVLSGLLPNPVSATVAAAGSSVADVSLLASVRGAAQLPFLLLGVAAFLFHVGVYARLAALAFLAETSVRRLSYAGMFVGTTVVVTVGLALCGIHLGR